MIPQALHADSHSNASLHQHVSFCRLYSSFMWRLEELSSLLQVKPTEKQGNNQKQTNKQTHYNYHNNYKSLGATTFKKHN